MATKKLQILGSFGSSIEVDSTLTQTGKAADAKSTGDAISSLTTLVGDESVADQVANAINSANHLSVDVTDAESGTANLINSDTFGGYAVSDFVLESELNTYKNDVSTNYALKTDTIANSELFEGYNVDQLRSMILDMAHPVGSYYWSTNSTDPSTLFGGIWTRVKDRFVLAAGDSYSVNATGGSAQETLTESQIPNHSHVEVLHVSGIGFGYMPGETAHTVNKDTLYSMNTDYVNTRTNSGALMSTLSTGGSAAHNNMPPYMVAYCWYRTA